jgi:lipoyl(octanoyl) transferase
MHAMWLGLTTYEKSLDLQSDLAARCLEDRQSYLLGLEHPPSITLGKRATEALDLIWSESELSAKGLEKFEVDRGGEATLHSPGQLVIYPVLHLPSLDCSVKDYVGLLIRTTQKTLLQLGIPTDCHPGEPGLFVKDRKLVAFGIRIKKGVTQHGLAINCHNDLNLFESIRSCGVTGQKWTRLTDLGVSLSLRNLFKKWHQEFLLTAPRPRD